MPPSPADSRKKKKTNSEDRPQCNLSTQFVESKVNLLNKCGHALYKKTQDRLSI